MLVPTWAVMYSIRLPEVNASACFLHNGFEASVKLGGFVVVLLSVAVQVVVDCWTGGPLLHLEVNAVVDMFDRSVKF